MKKSNFITLVMGTVSGLLFALGMCMALLPEWNLMTEGIIIGIAGAILSIVTVWLWRKMEQKEPLRLSGKTVRAILVGIEGALLLGTGMCFCMVWSNMGLGILIGVAGIVVLLCLIPLIAGLK